MAMSSDFPDFIARLLFETVCSPIRDRHSIITIAHMPALFAGIAAIGHGITRLIPPKSVLNP